MAIDKNKIVLDLDGVLAHIDNELEYEDRALNRDVGMAASNAAEENFNIEIFSARNMRTYQGDLEKINSHTRPIIESWLKRNSVKYNELILGKVWNGPEGFYVDDNNLHVEEFLFRFNGPLRKYRFDIVVPFFNEENNVNKVYENLTKANRLIRVNRLVFVNNGSTDGTANALMKLSKKDSRVRVIEVRKNKGYGHGMKVGMKECTSDYIITTHGDNQFKLYEYLLINMDNIVRDFSDGSSIFSIRGGRGYREIFVTFLLKSILSFILFKRVREFNGQPKIMPIKSIKDIDSLPNDYTFDLNLYHLCSDHNIIYLQNIQYNRECGKSSWSALNSLGILISYIKKGLYLKYGD